MEEEIKLCKHCFPHYRAKEGYKLTKIKEIEDCIFWQPGSVTEAAAKIELIG